MNLRISQRIFAQPSQDCASSKTSNQSQQQLKDKSREIAFGSSGLDFQSFYTVMGVTMAVGIAVIGGIVTALNVAIKIDDKKTAKAKKILEDEKAKTREILVEAKKMGNLFILDDYKGQRKGKSSKVHKIRIKYR